MSRPPLADPANRAEQLIVADRAERLDKVLTRALSDLTRSQLRQWFDQGLIRCGEEVMRPGSVAVVGQTYRVGRPEPRKSALDREDSIPLSIVFEDEDVLIINKAPGFSVHPSHTERGGTIVNALLALDRSWSTLGGEERPGIVHRLDKHTSGLLVVAKNDTAHRHLVEQFSQRLVEKTYVAFVYGTPPKSGDWKEPIGRHPTDRKRFSTRATSAKPAHTSFSTVASYSGASELRLELHTGRTHQIRVHASDAGYPLIGDPVYVPRTSAAKKARALLPEWAQDFGRQALHAERLGIRLPKQKSGKKRFLAPWPEDLLTLQRVLRAGGDPASLADGPKKRSI